jgi:hypothetical protein
MSKTIFITLNNSGGDPGPYTLTLIDGVGNETLWPSNPITKAQLTAGYQMIVPDLIVKVKVQSETCTTYVELIIPTTQCPCRIVNFVNGVYRFYECGSTLQTELNVGPSILSYCVDTTRSITKVSGTGGYTDTGICCAPSPNPVPTPTTTTSSTTSTTSTTSTSTTSSTTTSTSTSSTTTTSTTTTTTAATCALFLLNGGLSGRTFVYRRCGESETTTTIVNAGDQTEECIQLPFFSIGAVNTGDC